MPNGRRINAIQDLRGIAALLVVIAHSILHFLQNAGPATARPEYLIQVAESLGRHGVEIFFLISGFIMTVTSYDDFAKPHAARKFVWKRIVRIVPLYWLVTLLVILLTVVQQRAPSLAAVLQSLAFIPYENGVGTFQPIVRRGWTLNYEMFFYALFALALLQPARRGLIVLLSALVGLVFLGFLGMTDGCGSRACGIIRFYQEPVVLYFAGGIVLGAVRRFLEKRNWMPGIRFDNGLIVALALTGAFVILVLHSPSGSSTHAVGAVICFLTTASCALLEDRAEQGRLRFVVLLVGEASYSIYLTHTFVTHPAAALWVSLSGGRGLVAFIALMLVGASLLGVLVFRFVEKPMLQALRKGVPRLKARPSA